jgi:hypothetical protein
MINHPSSDPSPPLTQNPLTPDAGLTARELKRIDKVLASVASEMDPGGLEAEIDDPKSWKEVRMMDDGEEWEGAVREELDSLKEMEVYELIPPEAVPKGTSVRKGKLVFKRKKNELGETIR